jgi:DNA-binding CsgD family transcriptional regulator
VTRCADPIALVEAAYALGASDLQWTAGLAEAALSVVPDAFAGMLAYHVRLEGEVVHLMHPAATPEAQSAGASLRRLQDSLERRRAGTASIAERLVARTYSRALRTMLRQPVDRLLLLAEYKLLAPKWMLTFAVPGVNEVLLLNCPQLDGNNFTVLSAGLPTSQTLTSKERLRFSMVAAHIRAGYRLRQRLSELQQPALQADAVLDPKTMRVVHAEGEAQGRDARALLRETAMRVDRARTKQHGRDERALELWQGLVDGRWSLVDQFDSDGKRYVIAHRNAESVSDPRGLSTTEVSVLGLVARGYSNKLAAYHLGLSESRVSTMLHSGMSKLHINSRVELVRMFGVSS